MVYTERQSRFMWHQPCQRCKHTTSMDFQKCAIQILNKACHSVVTCERSESARERRVALDKSNHHLPSALQICSKNISFPKILDLPCFLFRADVFIHSKSPGRMLSVLSCVYLASYSQNACVCGCLCVCVRVYALRIV